MLADITESCCATDCITGKLNKTFSEVYFILPDLYYDLFSHCLGVYHLNIEIVGSLI